VRFFANQRTSVEKHFMPNVSEAQDQVQPLRYAKENLFAIDG